MNFQKHLGMYLGEALIFSYDVKEIISKAMKGTDYMKKLIKTLLWYSLLQFIKHFLRFSLDYDDIIYDEPNNENFNEKS